MGGPPFTGRLQPIILKTPDTKEWGHQKSLPLITFVELCDLSMMHGTHQRGPRWSNGLTKLLLWIQTLICKTKAHILWKWGKKMSLMRFCEQSWHSVTSEQIFLRKWKLLHLRGSDVIPLYQPTAREIKLMTNSEICRFYIFFIAKCKMGGGTVNDRIWLLIWKCWEYTSLSVKDVYTNDAYKNVCSKYWPPNSHIPWRIREGV